MCILITKGSVNASIPLEFVVHWLKAYIKGRGADFLCSPNKKYSGIINLNYLNALTALSTAITITPTSANTAAHILAIPSAPKTRQSALIASAKTIFS